MPFASDFIWGAATASYQIEGASLEDGRGECIWHRFSHTPGKVNNGDTGDVACDHYHRYPEDIALMGSLGLKAYRFSVAWSRVIPQGTGASNPAGLDFYDRLVDGLLAAGIRPFLTAYHWDLPHALQDQGGWANRDSIAWFTDYISLLAGRLGDRVKDWITFNEPWVVAFVGNYQGRHAPGIQHLPTACKVAHHELMSHGAAVPVLRELVPDARVGITLDQTYIMPLTDSPADQKAAANLDGFHNRWFLDPVFKGVYPADIVEVLGDNLEGIHLDEISAANVPLDFLGINYYTRNRVAWTDDYVPFHYKEVKPQDAEFTDMNWEVYPDGLYQTLVNISQTYAPREIYITENGAAFPDTLEADGRVNDARRVAYYEGHFGAVERAIEAGVPMKGYFAWSLLDNFEWAEGYAKRFGLVYVDYATQKRYPKDSAYFYRDFIANRVAEGV